MKLIYLILGLLLIVGACVVAVFLADEPTASTGAAHATIAAIQSGGDGFARFTPVATVTLVMQSAIFIMFGLLLYLGISVHRRTRQCKVWIAAGTMALLFVWWSIYGTYSEYLASGELRMFLGFPVPTAFTVYGLWLAGFVFVIAYVVGFRSFIFTVQDEAAYHELLEKHKRDGAAD
jgi:uncharacterized membrane protein YecN with MAPEG domain